MARGFWPRHCCGCRQVHVPGESGQQSCILPFSGFLGDLSAPSAAQVCSWKKTADKQLTVAKSSKTTGNTLPSELNQSLTCFVLPWKATQLAAKAWHFTGHVVFMEASSKSPKYFASSDSWKSFFQLSANFLTAQCGGLKWGGHKNVLPILQLCVGHCACSMILYFWLHPKSGLCSFHQLVFGDEGGLQAVLSSLRGEQRSSLKNHCSKRGLGKRWLPPVGPISASRLRLRCWVWELMCSAFTVTFVLICLFFVSTLPNQRTCDASHKRAIFNQ